MGREGEIGIAGDFEGVGGPWVGGLGKDIMFGEACGRAKWARKIGV